MGLPVIYDGWMIRSMEKINLKKIVLIVIVVSGIVIPFVDYLVVIEFFYLLIPLAIAFLGCLIFFIGTSFIRKNSIKKAVYISSIIPIFVGSQLLSTLTVNKVQKFRSELLIKEIESIKKTTGLVPDNINAPLGIKFSKIESQNNYRISYSRGFMIKEVYDNACKSWKSYGWND